MTKKYSNKSYGSLNEYNETRNFFNQYIQDIQRPVTILETLQTQDCNASDPESNFYPERDACDASYVYFNNMGPKSKIT